MPLADWIASPDFAVRFARSIYVLAFRTTFLSSLAAYYTKVCHSLSAFVVSHCVHPIGKLHPRFEEQEEGCCCGLACFGYIFPS